MIPLTEHEESVILANWLDVKGLLYSKIPSETYTTSWNQKRKNKIEGVKKGVPDYFILINSNVGRTVLVCIELKRVKGGVVSLEQKEWIKQLNKVADVEAHVCKGADVAIEIIKELL
jgi:hypothetical protein|tara:strand:- start:20177 stop:20527 length:351 start_codon:yes stop_codon:yes gene_type:complete